MENGTALGSSRDNYPSLARISMKLYLSGYRAAEKHGFCAVLLEKKRVAILFLFLAIVFPCFAGLSSVYTKAENNGTERIILKNNIMID